MHLIDMGTSKSARKKLKIKNELESKIDMIRRVKCDTIRILYELLCFSYK